MCPLPDFPGYCWVTLLTVSLVNVLLPAFLPTAVNSESAASKLSVLVGSLSASAFVAVTALGLWVYSLRVSKRLADMHKIEDLDSARTEVRQYRVSPVECIHAWNPIQ